LAFITARTPFRISFFGGGTDYPAWYRERGGAVLSTAINKYCYITCRYLPPFFQQRHRIVWSHIENVNSISEILHPAVREGLKMLKFTDDRGIELHHHADVPARAGMGSSSAFANALILALTTLRGDSLSKHELFRLALDLEQTRLKENVGSQDQVATAVGGLNHIIFYPDNRIDVVPLAMDAIRQVRLQGSLMLFYTGTSRLATEVARNIIANIPARATELTAMHQLVDDAVKLLKGDGDIDQFGAMLHETWERKRRLSAEISNEGIDDIYQRARRAGALGGKLLGAGAAGFMVFYVQPDRQAAVREALRTLLHVPFEFDFEGATLVQTIVAPEPARGQARIAVKRVSRAQ
jgi:D-glycero-alpha-D-manno-heptose-7-phosphate kinase